MPSYTREQMDELIAIWDKLEQEPDPDKILELQKRGVAILKEADHDQPATH